MPHAGWAARSPRTTHTCPYTNGEPAGRAGGDGGLGPRLVGDGRAAVEFHLAVRGVVFLGLGGVVLSDEEWVEEKLFPYLKHTGPSLSPFNAWVLLKALDDRGFTFFTNYDSDKGQQLAAEPRASLLFTWLQLHRQVRVVGSVERVPEAESDEYFASRPRPSQIGQLLFVSRPTLSRTRLRVISPTVSGSKRA